MTGPLRPTPFVHLGETRIRNPARGTVLDPGPAADAVRGLASGTVKVEDLDPALAASLTRDGWLVADPRAEARAFHLRFVSLESHSVCNQRCSFCPVSVAPRPPETMEPALFEAILDQLVAFRATLEAVFLSNYNEPTADPLFLDRIDAVHARGLAVALLTNGTGLTPARSRELVDRGGIRHLSVNLSTLDREEYARERGADHLPRVLANLDAVRDQPVAADMRIAVIGPGDAAHRGRAGAIRAHFAGSRFEVREFTAVNRAGYLATGLGPAAAMGRLRGCENLGSRPFEHLHVVPDGTCVLCCNDYEERYPIGRLGPETVAEVLAGPRVAELRAQIYGLDPPEEGLICLSCSAAIAGEPV